MKKNKEDIKYIVLLIVAFIIMVFIITRGKFMYGSKLDWYSEHFAIPEYFRTLFYHTKDLFPDFALSIGGGQNIYNLSYYGFLSPHILLSYLLPIVPMNVYIPIITSISSIVSSIMMYVFLRKKDYRRDISFVASLIFLLSSPMSFHTHRHIMFINYMPFVMLGLFGIDKLLDKNKKSLLILSVFLMIMTNYYFSIGGLFTLFLYALFRHISWSDKFEFKKMFNTFIKVLVPVLIGILCSSIIILPTLATILYNRAPSNVVIELKRLLLPDINTKNIMYHPYGLGLSSIVLFALINMFKHDKAHKTLSVILILMFSFNIFNYILNGTMYIDSKALIPLLPLYIYTIAVFIKDVLDKKVNYKKYIFPLILITLLVIKGEYAKEAFIPDVLILSVIFYLYTKNNNDKHFIFALSILTILSSIGINLTDHLVPIKPNKLDAFNAKVNIDYITENDNSFYRIGNDLNAGEFVNRTFMNPNYNMSTIYSSISNQKYNKLYYDTLFNNISTRNRALTVYQPNLMGLMLNNNKYLISKKEPLYGYELIKKTNDIKIYKNDNVFPIGFGTSSIMSYDEFNKLSDEVKQEALLNIIVVHDKSSHKFKPTIRKIEVDIDSILNGDNIIKNNDGTYTINSDGKFNIVHELSEKYKNKIILLSFDMNKKSYSRDLTISINSVQNKLTNARWKYYNGNERFNYVLADKNQDILDIKFSKGTYNIGDFSVYMLDYEDIKYNKDKFDHFTVKEAKGDKIEGTVNMEKGGYFMFTLPYDKGFKVSVDNKEIPYECADNGYIGFKLNKGNHDIKLEYNSPLKTMSMCLSGLGVVLLITIFNYEKNSKK